MSFSQKTKDNINGWGSVFRFVTPVLLTITLFILGGIKTEIKDVKIDTCKRLDNIVLQFTNHLEHHRILEVSLAEKFATLQAKFEGVRF